MWWVEWMEDKGWLRREVNRLRHAWAKMLADYPWSHFVTLTMETEVSRDVLERMVREYLARLESGMGKRWWWAFTVEGGSSIRPHVHVLIGGLANSSAAERRLQEAWGRRGRVDVVSAADRPNAEAYLVKALELDYEHIDVAPGLPGKVRAWHQRERHRAQVPRWYPHEAARVPMNVMHSP